MKARILTFSKCFNRKSHEQNNHWWMTLGHFDEMQCSEPLDLSLPEIKSHNDNIYRMDSADEHHHVIYLINSDDSDNGSEDSSFFIDDAQFMAVTRIHFTEAINLITQFNTLYNHFNTLSGLEIGKGITWKIYYTTELSDMVLVSKSDSFHELSKWALSVTIHKAIGKAFTYFCFPGKLVSDPTSNFEQYVNDHVDFIVLRFVVRAGKNTDVCVELNQVLNVLGIPAPGTDSASSEKEVQPALFRVTGNEDALICLRNVSVSNLLKLYQSWYNSPKAFDVFREISARVGINYCTNSKLESTTTGETESGNDDNKAENNSLKHASGKIAYKAHNCIETLANGGEQEWFRPLVELTIALVHMSNSAILDEPVFLILPGLNAFWENVNHNRIAPQDTKLYLRFAELCVHTMEHIMRAEGPLSQRVEVRPLAYDIPVFLLEYISSFLIVLSKEMIVQEQNAERIRFILMPGAVESVSTIELFRSNHECPGLLQITVPFSLLYFPQQLIPQLCHEMAHYIGEKLRLRELRYDLFLSCAASELIVNIFEKVSGKRESLFIFLKENYFRHYIGLGSKKLFKGETHNIPLLKICDLIDFLVAPLKEPEGYAELIRRYIDRHKLYGARFICMPEEIQKERIESFELRLIDMAILFRETYADACMVEFLGLSIDEYIDLLLNENNMSYYTTILRLYVVLYSIDKDSEKIKTVLNHWIEKRHNPDGDVQIDSIKKLVNVAGELILDNTTPEFYLSKYIVECQKQLKIVFSDSDHGEENVSAQQIYRKLVDNETDSGQLSYSDILRVIDAGRMETFEQLKIDIADGKSKMES